MAKNLLVLIALVLLSSCNNAEVSTSTKMQLPTSDTANPDDVVYEKAKALVDSANSYVELSDTKKMSVKKANAKINPIMKDVDSLNNRLTMEGQARLKAYRIQKINELIDRKVQRDN